MDAILCANEERPDAAAVDWCQCEEPQHDHGQQEHQIHAHGAAAPDAESVRTLIGRRQLCVACRQAGHLGAWRS